MSTIPKRITEYFMKNMFDHIFQQQNEVTNVRYHCKKYSAISYTAYIMDANGVIHQLNIIQELPEKKK